MNIFKLNKILINLTLPFFVALAVVFLFLNVVTINGLQDWWPSLLKHWVNNLELYRDVHYFSGPLYPILLRFIGVVFDVNSSPIILGLVVSLLYLLAALAMLNSYAVAIKYDYRTRYIWLLIFSLFFFFLIISRYTAIYLTVGDYHTLSLLVYCLIVNRALSERHDSIECYNFLDKLSLTFALIPNSFLAAVLLLNRFHEGLLFLITYPIYLGLKSYSEVPAGWGKIAALGAIRFVVGTAGCVLVIYYVASLFFGLPSIVVMLDYILFVAPEAKGAHESGYAFKVVLSYINTYWPTFRIIAVGLFVFATYRAIRHAIKQDVLAGKALDLAFYIFIFFLFFFLLKEGRSHSYLLSLNNILLLGVVSILFYSLRYNWHAFQRFDFSVILVLSLIGGHVASTSGIYNQAFAIFLLPSLALSLKGLLGEYRLDNKMVVLIFVAALGFGISIFSQKFSTPRTWWLDTEPSISASRDFTFGKSFTDKYPNVKESPTYASSDFLGLVQSMCAEVRNSQSDQMLVLSYPVSYFETACKGGENMKSISNHYVLWNDVSLLAHLDELTANLSENKVHADYIFLQINPWSIEYSSRYFWLDRSMESWPHYKFQNFIYEYSRKNMVPAKMAYLKRGSPVVDEEEIEELDLLRQDGCFNMNDFVRNKTCKNGFFDAVGTWDVTLVIMYKKLNIH